MPGQELQELACIALIGLKRICGEASFAGKAGQPKGALLKQVRRRDGQDLGQFGLALHWQIAGPPYRHAVRKMLKDDAGLSFFNHIGLQ